MWTDPARRRMAALRQPARAARIARGLWIAWAVVAWNLVFDYSIVTAGRDYVRAAVQNAQNAQNAPTGDAGAPALRMDDWMRPAVTRGLWTATAVGGAVLATGLLSVRRAGRAAASSSISSRQDG